MFLHGGPLGDDRLINDKSDVLELTREEDMSMSDSSLLEEATWQFEYFRMHPRIKDFTKRVKVDPINHLIRRKNREMRDPLLTRPEERARLRAAKAKSLSPVRVDPFSHLPDYWDRYQKMLQMYHRRDKARQAQVRGYFEKVIKRINRLCNEEEDFAADIKTRIVKEQPQTKSRRSHTMGLTSQESNLNAQSNGGSVLKGAEPARIEGDVNALLSKVRKVEEENAR